LDADDLALEDVEDAPNLIAESAVRQITASNQDKGLGEVLHIAFTQTRARNPRAVRPRFNQATIARKRRLKLNREARRLEREADALNCADQALLSLTEHARIVGRPLDEILVARGEGRRALDKVLVQLVVQYGRKPVLLATGYTPAQLTRSYKRGLK
jgi:hypothetical protein